jgi:hypothetical protein
MVGMADWRYSIHVMELTAKEATVLTLLSARPSTRLFARLVDKLDSPNAKAVAQKIRERAAAEADLAQPETVTGQR